MPEEQPEQGFNIVLPPQEMAGVWANYANISQSPYEFTLDFVRLDFTLNAGIVVARVSMSPLFVSQLIDALQTTWAKYVERAMPQEVQDGPAEGEGDTPADPGA